MLSRGRLLDLWAKARLRCWRGGAADDVEVIVAFARLVAAAELENLTRDADIDRIVRAMLRARARKNREAALPPTEEEAADAEL